MSSNTLRLVKGLNWEYTGRLLDSENQPIDLVGYQAKMKIRISLASSEVLAELTTENGRIELLNDGKFILRLPSLLTETFPLGHVSFDILFITPLGKHILLAEGARIRVVDYISR